MKGRKTLKIVLFSLLGALALVIGILIAYLGKQWNRTTFFAKTTINGYDASEMTPDQVLPEIVNAYSAPKIHLTENGTEEAVWTLQQLGYTVDQEKLLAALQGALGRQKSSISILMDGMMNGNEFEVDVPFAADDNVLAAAVTAANLKDPRIANVNAELAYDAEAKNYSITPEVQGNTFNDSDLQNLVRTEVQKLISAKTAGQDVNVEIPADMYIKPDVLSTDENLNLQMNTYNAYDKAVITYDFGTQTEQIDWNTIQNWVIFDNGQGYLSEDPIREYVTSLAARYNTIYYNREFTTTGGNVISFSDSENNYGYLVDEEGEYQQLVADIQSNTAVEREPVYSYSGVGRDGVNDLVEYVEINISAQHLWFYKNGSLIVDSPVVTGCVAKKNETQTGIFPVAYKQSPATLIPSNETNGTPVQYWMPFYDGQGLHDASWRSSFGGNIYQTNGSHGCVNLPPNVAAVIFENIDTGTPVILYK